ncbi:MAG: IS4 family transposase [Winogradskyella sp.]|uniref:IS4 family transposase n=1 Tax=Winogradskyella sp. TaxID=1883156 RepID=UPI00183F30D3|nr:IS4 family transposase [Winogradskyella sp.]
MNKIHHRKINDFLSELGIEDLAVRTGFTLRTARKITPEDFLISFFNVMISKCYSLRQWAVELSLLTGRTVSFQAIAKKLQFRQLPFLKALLLKGLKFQLREHDHLLSGKADVLFKRILIEDSTCVKLPNCLSQHYPGSRNQYGQKKAIARVQLCIDLLTNSFKSLELKSYCDNDATYADRILEYLKKGDLILRDRAYSVTKILKQITEKGAYYISLLHPKRHVKDADNEKVIDLVRVLKRLDKHNMIFLDKTVILGKTEKLEVRLVCVKLSQKEAQRRRRRPGSRRKGKNRRAATTTYLLGWNIFITNMPKELLTVKQVYNYYSLRWHIEMIFKTWKSHFKLDKIFSSCKGKNYAKPELLFYLCMLFLVLIYNPKFNYFQKVVYGKTGKLLSPMKFAKIVINHMEIIFQKESKDLIRIISKYCCYSTRKDRKNIYEKLLCY